MFISLDGHTSALKYVSPALHTLSPLVLSLVVSLTLSLVSVCSVCFQFIEQFFLPSYCTVSQNDNTLNMFYIPIVIYRSM